MSGKNGLCPRVFVAAQMLGEPHDAMNSFRGWTEADYLPAVGGCRAAWLVNGLKPVAITAQRWTAPRWLISPNPALFVARVARGPSKESKSWDVAVSRQKEA